MMHLAKSKVEEIVAISQGSPDKIQQTQNTEGRRHQRRRCSCLVDTQVTCCPSIEMRMKSEASRLKYANIALNEYNADGDDYELVELGPLALGSIDDDGFKLQEPGPLAPGSGSIPKGCLILHLNFKAKHNNEPHAVVETFFSELIKINEDDVRVVTVRCLGPTNLLPEKPATYGCLYCYLRNIHHPDDPLSFLRGGKYRFNFLFSVVPKISKYVRDGEKQHFIPLSFHPEVQFIHKFDKIESTSAAVALRMLNKKEKWNLELVKISAFGRVTLSIGFFLHINFEAKDKNNPDAPVQMFFAEVIFRNPTFFCDFCNCLESSTSSTDEADNGCTYCEGLPVPVHHPPGPGYMVGRETYPDWCGLDKI
uniref:DUF3615 domain-containing protein n=1 Tax=Chenopodium quinoa TaxID=63459 RepID=A0A803L895_CHEQI